MNGWTLTKRLWNIAWIGVLLVGCGGATEDVVPDATSDASYVTSDPALMSTLQAGLAETAAWIGSLTPPAVSGSTAIPALPPVSTGTPMALRSGICPAPDGFTPYQRDGFCISSPATWLVFNVDGGMAAFLNTTPGQAISIQPDWADSASVCHLLIFVTARRDVAEYLAANRDQIGARTDLKVLTPVTEQTLGTAGLYGFMWEDSAGKQGSVYAAPIGVNRLLHISMGGSDCPMESIVPSIETLRLN